MESAPGTPGLIALVFPWEGRDAFEGLMGRIRHVAPIIGIVRERGSGTIRLSRAGRPRIDYTLSARRPPDAGRDARRGGADRLGGRLARDGRRRDAAALVPGRTGTATSGRSASWQAGLRTFPFEPNRGTVVSAHQMGSARAGADPAGTRRTRRVGSGRPMRGRAATGRSRGLYVGDASAFPSALGVNPMMTTMAWARQVARTVLAEGAARGRLGRAFLGLGSRAAGSRGRGGDGSRLGRRRCGARPAAAGDDQRDGGDDHDATRRSCGA